ncbi:hypothetical protein ACTWKB_14155 [Bacillus sp. 4A_MP2]
MKKALYHEDSGLYLEKMRMAFQEHYEQRTDMWSTDPSLTDAAVMSLKAWRSREKDALASVLDIGCGTAGLLNIYKDCRHIPALIFMSMRNGKD